MANKKQTSTANLKSFMRAAIAILLAIIIAGTCICVIGYITKDEDGKWFHSLVQGSEEIKEPSDEQPTDKTPTEDDPSDEAGNDGFIIGDIEDDSEIALTSEQIPVSKYREYGISAAAESAYQVTVTVKNSAGESPASIQFVDFALAWAAESSEEVSDYVTLSVVNATTANLTCLQGFSTRIDLNVSSRLEPTRTATVKLDYLKRVIGNRSEIFKDSDSGERMDVYDGQVVDVDFGNFDTFIDASNNLWTYNRFRFHDGLIYSLYTKDIEYQYNNLTFGKMKFSDEVYSALVSKSDIFTNLPEYFDFTTLGSGVGALISQKALLQRLTGLQDTTDYAAWMTLMEVLSSYSNQIEVTPYLVTSMGSVLHSVSYKLNCHIEPNDIESLEPNPGSITF